MLKTIEMAYVATLAAIVCALGLLPPIPLPFSPVPITAQTLGVMLAGGLLGARLGGLSMLVFLAVVAAGAPVLSGGRGGLSAFVAPTAGFLWSFPISAFVIGYFIERNWERLTIWRAVAINFVGGILLVYAIGAPVLSFIANMDIVTAFVVNVAYLPGDIAKAVIAAYISVKMKAIRPMIRKNETFDA